MAEHALEAIGDERLRNACRVLPTPATVNLAILRYRHLSAISQSPPDIAEIVEKIQKEMLENSESIVSTVRPHRTLSNKLVIENCQGYLE